jgi:hypothetical protein
MFNPTQQQIPHKKGMPETEQEKLKDSSQI